MQATTFGSKIKTALSKREGESNNNRYTSNLLSLESVNSLWDSLLSGDLFVGFDVGFVTGEHLSDLTGTLAPHV